VFRSGDGVTPLEELERPGHEARLKRLQGAFQRVSAKSFKPRKRRLRRVFVWPPVAAIVLAAVTFYSIEMNHYARRFGSWDIAWKHIYAQTNCAAARQVGLAPALRGKPGYWRRLDADSDGIACEPLPGNRQ
jgi:hypothetical protein